MAKILYIALSCGPNLGSEDAVGWNVPLEMARMGHEVSVLTREDKRDEIELYLKTYSVGACPRFLYRRLPGFSRLLRGPLYSARASVWCRAVSREIASIALSGDFDVVHQITPVEFRSVVNLDGVDALRVVGPLGGGGEIAPLLARAYLSHRDCLVEALHGVMNWGAVHGRAPRAALAAHDLVFAANAETASELRRMGWSGALGIRSEVAVDRLRAGVRGSLPGLVIGAAGRLHYRKGFLFLLDVVAHIDEPNVRLRIAGDGDLRPVIEERARELGISDRVELLGRLSYHEMEGFYRGIDVFAFPSFREATGTVLVEAMAAGVPVVSFDLFGAREVLRDAPGSLVELGSDLEATICAFAERLVDRGLVTVAPRTWREHAEWLTNQYQACLGPDGRRREARS